MRGEHQIVFDLYYKIPKKRFRLKYPYLLITQVNLLKSKNAYVLHNNALKMAIDSKIM